MAITDANDIKRLVRQTISVPELTNAVTAGDRKIVALTNRDIEDWDPSDNAYGQLQAVGAAYAAWTILMGWDKEDYLDKAKEMWKAYEYEVNQFKGMYLPDNRGNPDVKFGESEYTHYKLNPTQKPFLSEY